MGKSRCLIQEIYKNGGRKFGFLNVEPMGCFPYARAVLQNNTCGCVDELTVLAKLHNRALTKALEELMGQLKGFKYSNFDFHASLSERINNPSKYGIIPFTSTTRPCIKEFSHDLCFRFSFTYYNHLRFVGFKEGKVACCGTGPYRGILSCGGKRTIKEYQLCDDASEHLFFDGSHPTEKANYQFAKLMWTGSPSVTGPCNLQTLVQE
jgi:hypothetical protein